MELFDLIRLVDFFLNFQRVTCILLKCESAFSIELCHARFAAVLVVHVHMLRGTDGILFDVMSQCCSRSVQATTSLKVVVQPTQLARAMTSNLVWQPRSVNGNIATI